MIPSGQRGIDAVDKYQRRYPIEQHYSSFTKETLNIYSENEPPLEDQAKWFDSHKDSVLVYLYKSETAAHVTPHDQYILNRNEQNVDLGEETDND